LTVSVNMNIIITYSLAVLVTIHSYKFRGTYKTLLLFLGAVIIGGGIENANATFGGYHYPGSEFTLFLGECPFDVILGWFVIIYCSSYFSHIIIGKGRGSRPAIGIGTNPKNGIDRTFIKDTFLRAALAGYIAVNLDFLVDPVAVENKWWIWEVDNIYIIGVPLGNYIGWFFLIFFTCFFYDYIITYCTINDFKQYKTSAFWSLGTILVCLLTGGILSQLTILFGLDGIRTDDRVPINAAITPERVPGLIFTLLLVLITILLIMAVSFIPDKTPAQKSNNIIWWILPSIIMLIFWAMVMVVAFFTSALMVAIGFLFCIPYLVICIYLIVNPYTEEE